MTRREVVVCALCARDLSDMLAYGREIANQTGEGLAALLVSEAKDERTRAQDLEAAYRMAKRQGAELTCLYSDEPECELLRRIARTEAKHLVIRREWPIAGRIARQAKNSQVYLYSEKRLPITIQPAAGTA